MQMPALQKAASIRPNWPRISAMVASTCSLSVTSHLRARVLQPLAAAISWAVFWASSMSTSTMATSAPASASAVAMALPMPRAPPVTKAFLPSNRNFSMMPISLHSNSLFVLSIRLLNPLGFPQPL